MQALPLIMRAVFIITPASLDGRIQSGLKSSSDMPSVPISKLLMSMKVNWFTFAGTHYKESCHDVNFQYRDCLPKIEQPIHNYTLKTLVFHLLGEDVQGGGVHDHNAVFDAMITMRLYRLDELVFEVNAHLWDVD